MQADERESQRGEEKLMKKQENWWRAGKLLKNMKS